MKFLIQITGGVLDSVWTDTKQRVEVDVYDWDNLEDLNNADHIKDLEADAEASTSKMSRIY